VVEGDSEFAGAENGGPKKKKKTEKNTAGK